MWARSRWKRRGISRIKAEKRSSYCSQQTEVERIESKDSRPTSQRIDAIKERITFKIGHYLNGHFISFRLQKSGQIFLQKFFLWTDTSHPGFPVSGRRYWIWFGYQPLKFADPFLDYRPRVCLIDTGCSPDRTMYDERGSPSSNPLRSILIRAANWNVPRTLYRSRRIKTEGNYSRRIFQASRMSMN